MTTHSSPRQVIPRCLEIHVDQLLSGQVSNLIDVIEDGPESAEILSSYEG